MIAWADHPDPPHHGLISHINQALGQNRGFADTKHFAGIAIEILRPGMTFTVEPMLNTGSKHVKLLPDGWTVVTKDHGLSAQWEHTVVVTETGYEILTLRPEETV